MKKDIVSTKQDTKQMEEDLAQIKRDLGRTFPKCEYFAEGREGQPLMERILATFSKYDPKIGYVQGMNFIVGALLYHCSEEIAFWLFVTLVEDHDMRDIYLPGNFYFLI